MTTRKRLAGKRPDDPALVLDMRPASLRVLRQFRVVFNAVKGHFQRVEKRAGIGGAQLWALSVIRDRPGVGVGDLASALDVHQSTASNLVRSLVERKLITAVRDSLDRRAVRLSLVAAGGRLLQRAPGPFAGVLPQALDALDDRMLARLDRDLSALIAALGADEGAGSVPLAQM